MKNMRLFLLYITFCMIVPMTLSAQVWVEKAQFIGEARHHPITWSIGDYGYVMGGTTPSDNYTKDFYKYDASKNSWTQLKDFPGTARSFSISAVYNGKAYIGFGTDGDNGLNDLWSYDPDTENWEQLASCPCDGRGHPAFTINQQFGKLYVGLGNYGIISGNYKDWWEYDITNNLWTQKDDFPGTKRHHPFHFSMGAYSYVGMGHDHNPLMATDDLYRFDPSDDTWKEMANAPGRRIAGTQFDLNGYGYVLSGDGNYHQFTDVSIFWRYNPDSDTWTQLIPHPGPSRWAPGSFVIHGVAYLFGGLAGDDDLKNDLWSADLNVLSNTNTIEKGTLQIFPNPTADYLYITHPDLEAYMMINVYDITGKNVLRRSLEQKINVSSLAPGVYTLEIQNDSNILFHSRFIKN